MRIISWLFLVAGIGAAIWDFMIVPESPPRLRALGEHWFAFAPDSLQLLQPALERHVSPTLWDPVMLTLLEQSTALLLGGLGVFLLLIAVGMPTRRGPRRR